MGLILGIRLIREWEDGEIGNNSNLQNESIYNYYL